MRERANVTELTRKRLQPARVVQYAHTLDQLSAAQAARFRRKPAASKTRLGRGRPLLAHSISLHKQWATGCSPRFAP